MPRHPEIVESAAEPKLKSLVFIGDANQQGSTPDAAQECEALLQKMVAAMKINWDDVDLLHWQSNEVVPTDAVIAQYKVAICLGAAAAQRLLQSSDGFDQLHGQWCNLRTNPSCAVLITYHPRELLREPQLKRAAWDHLQLAMKRLSESTDHVSTN